MLRSRYSTPRPADSITPLTSRHRVTRQRDGEAALLCDAQPGTAMLEHTHGHDEECLMVQGERFVDDVSLQPDDYQLAGQAAGTGSLKPTPAW